jgi:hypothetical protein
VVHVFPRALPFKKNKTATTQTCPYFTLINARIGSKGENGKEKKTGPDMIRACEGLSLGLELYNVGCFGALGRVDNVELNLLAFGQRLEAAVLNVAEVNEHIAA